jgi:peptidyl-prolyl cis-trans isomerase SurA
MKKILTIIVIIISGSVLHAQQLVDKIVAQVDDKIIMKSEIETFYLQELQNRELPVDYRCNILQELITQKIMLIQAAKDSLVVTDDEVEATLDNRIRYFQSLFGTAEKMEEFYGKSIQEIKEEFRDDVFNLLMIQKMQASIFGDVNVSPAEVKEFFNSIPKDSLPLINAEVELSQLVIIPKANAEQKQIAKKKGEDLRTRILNGEDFCVLAGIYSQDPGSKDNCGELGCTTREAFATEFSAAAFKLKPGETSEVIETEFGYHIIQMESRQGDKACLRHILIIPPVTNTNMVIANKSIDSIRALIVTGKITFCNAAAKYSDDEGTSKTCGDIVNSQTGDVSFEVSELSPDDYYAIENLSPGEVSQVLPFTTADGKKAVRIVMLKSQSTPHELNLKDDYARLQQFALSKKQGELLNKWVDEKIKKVYLKIDPTYSDCENINTLMETANN